MMKFQDWLKIDEAKIPEVDVPASIDPFVADFLSVIQARSLDDNSLILEDWWCSRSENIWLGHSPENRDLATVRAAEEEESVERRKKHQKNITPYYVVELRLSKNAMERHYGLVGIDMESKRWFFKQCGKYQETLDDILRNLLKKHYPIKSVSRKYGLE